MTTVAGDAQATFCATLVDEWSRGGVTDAVVCPGSRSTPLALSLVRHATIRVTVRLDERGAAWFALGLALSSGRPVVVLTTSGTAAAELHAAVIEASQARVPLIVCTADRPPELQQVGAPQTIDQARLYGSAARYFVDPGPPAAYPPAAWRSLASRLLAEATSGPFGPGPVHLNLPLREPLAGAPGPLPTGRPGGRPFHAVQPRRAAAATVALAKALDPARRGVILAGAERRAVSPGSASQNGQSRPTGSKTPTTPETRTSEGAAGEAAVALASRLGWPLLADPRSGARRPVSGVVTVAAADSLLRTPWAEQMVPDVVVRTGDLWASKSLGSWLSAGAATGAEQISFEPDWAWRDSARQVDVVVPAALDLDLVEALVPARPPASSSHGEWLERWAAAEAAAQDGIDEALAGAHPAVTEPGVARDLFEWVAPGGTVFASSSMPIRDLEWYARPRLDPPAVLANRGANGIDGVVSTLFGVSAERGLTYGLVGDLAVLHDASALVRSARGSLAMPAVVVVVDNQGGGIFSFLPQATELSGHEFELLFGTPQEPSVADLVSGCGYPTVTVTRAAELEPALEASTTRALSKGLPAFVVVRTDRTANVAVHREIEAAVTRRLESLS
ncbi:MAG: 2-succinyl-5-enolpyruvyl-6-hydroxy-3-cyclohexene-1-carboxylate synthase [Acidimicrobiales bacterium]